MGIEYSYKSNEQIFESNCCQHQYENLFNFSQDITESQKVSKNKYPVSTMRLEFFSSAIEKIFQCIYQVASDKYPQNALEM